MMLSAESLGVVRGGSEVLRDVSAQFAPGQITAIVGPNGAGKTSLLMALAGLLEPASGAVLLEERALATIDPRQRARSIGYLPQNGDVAWDVSIETLVALGRMPHGDGQSEAGRKAIGVAISALGLEALRDRPISRVSGGEKARVLLARVLAGEPQWILADEPLAALDLAHQATLIDHLKSCARRGAGVVIVLHDLAVAMNHADRVVVLSEGMLSAASAPGEALTRERIARVWGVETHWLGVPGRHALATLGHE